MCQICEWGSWWSCLCGGRDWEGKSPEGRNTWFSICVCDTGGSFFSALKIY